MTTQPRTIILLSLLCVCLLLFSNRTTEAVVLDHEQVKITATVGSLFEAKGTPSAIKLIEDKYLGLTMFGNFCAEISVASNAPYTVTYRTMNADGNIKNGSGYPLNTYYSILPPGSPQPASLLTPGWIKGSELRKVAESPDSQHKYRKLLCVAAAQLPVLDTILKNIGRYSLRIYTDTVIVTAENSSGSSAAVYINISYDPFQ